MRSREFHNLIVIGTIDAVSEDGTKARIRVGDILTKFLSLPAVYSQNMTGWLPAHESAQVILNCPSGNTEAGVIVGWLWPEGVTPHTSDRHIDGLRFNDGTTLEYDSQTKKLSVTSVGDLDIQVTGKLTISADTIEIAGPITQTGGDITSDGISVQHHKHPETGTQTQEPS